MSDTPDIITIGESLIELSSEHNMTTSDVLNKYYGGDTLTTAIAALRSGAKVGFISRIGMDCFKNYLLESWQEEGLDISRVKPVEGVNGIYVISKAPDGVSNEFSFYRKKTAATNLSAEDISADYIKTASVFYATGITQSLSISAREAVLKGYKIAKENNVKTAYDLNFNSKLMTKDVAKEAFDEISEYIDILFLNIKHDVPVLTEAETPENIIKFFTNEGISSVILKSSADKGVFAGTNGKFEFIKYPFDEPAIDSTGCGDTFNGGVLYGISSGMNLFKSVTYATYMAGLQRKKIGAIKSIPSKEEINKVIREQNG